MLVLSQPKLRGSFILLPEIHTFTQLAAVSVSEQIQNTEPQVKRRTELYSGLGRPPANGGPDTE